MRSGLSRGLGCYFYDVEGNEFFTKSKMGGQKVLDLTWLKQYKGKEGNTPWNLNNDSTFRL
jgi:hypothetical protein